MYQWQPPTPPGTNISSFPDSRTRLDSDLHGDTQTKGLILKQMSGTASVHLSRVFFFIQPHQHPPPSLRNSAWFTGFSLLLAAFIFQIYKVWVTVICVTGLHQDWKGEKSWSVFMMSLQIISSESSWALEPRINSWSPSYLFLRIFFSLSIRTLHSGPLPQTPAACWWGRHHRTGCVAAPGPYAGQSEEGVWVHWGGSCWSEQLDLQIDRKTEC